MMNDTLIALSWPVIDWSTMDWSLMIPEFVGKAAGVIAGFAVSWFVLIRRRFKALEKAQRGDSDDLIYQAHFLLPIDSEDRHDRVLVFRNIAPKTTVNDLYDNIAVRKAVKDLAAGTQLASPILKTEGTMGFELLNDAMGHIAGLMALSAASRENWLFAMTCEDRQIVRKQCVRCFLVRPTDLEKFADWSWCTRHVRVEQPWHWFRVVALHQMALAFRRESDAKAKRLQQGSMPLVDDQHQHARIRTLSIGIHGGEKAIGEPHAIDWTAKSDSLQRLGLKLETPSVDASSSLEA